MGTTRIATAVAACLVAALLMPVTGPLASGNPQAGKPCPQTGISVQQGKKTLVCKKRKGKLVWVVDNSGGGTGGGSGDIRDQPVPANGVWKVMPNYPTDLPPLGWRGEPAWFNSNWEVVTTTPVGRPCSATPLTHLVADLSAIGSVTPQGYMQPGSHAMPVPHMYYNTVREASVDTNGVPRPTKVVDVYAPADMTIRGVVRQRKLSSQQVPFNEYLVSASICGTLWFFSAHLIDLSPTITAALSSAPRKECDTSAGTTEDMACIYSYLSIKLQGGERIARASGYAHGFDFGFTDASAPITGRLDPGAFTPRWNASRCHIDYYPPAMQQQLRAKLIGDNGCGQLVSDRAGTASGVWLAVGQRANASREDLHVALARHWSEKSARTISIGWEANVPGVAGGTYTFSATASGNNRDFTLVAPGEVACYDNLTRLSTTDPSAAVPSIYVRMTTGTVERLQIAGAPGPCAAEPTMPASFQTFERRTTSG
jgi:hypothetical protein